MEGAKDSDEEEKERKEGGGGGQIEGAGEEDGGGTLEFEAEQLEMCESDREAHEMRALYQESTDDDESQDRNLHLGFGGTREALLLRAKEDDPFKDWTEVLMLRTCRTSMQNMILLENKNTRNFLTF